MTTPNPSQNEIARVAGVSRSTVSRALSNHVGTSEETKVRIRKIAEDLGYQKNATVSMLTAQIRMSRLVRPTLTLAYITTFPRPGIADVSPAYELFYEGAKQRAEELGYGLDIIWGKAPSMRAARMEKILLSRGIRGLLLAPRPHALAHITLDWSKFSAVSIGHSMPAPQLHSVSPSHFQIMALALRMAKKYGYRRIGFAIAPTSDKYTSHAFSSRYTFFQSLLPKEQRVPLPYPLMTEAPFERKAFEQWVKRSRPDLLLSQGDGILKWLEEMGLKVPDDIAFANVGIVTPDAFQAGICEMPQVVAASAVDLVVEQLHYNHRGIPAHPKLISIGGKWIDGCSMPNLRSSRRSDV